MQGHGSAKAQLVGAQKNTKKKRGGKKMTQAQEKYRDELWALQRHYDAAKTSWMDDRDGAMPDVCTQISWVCGAEQSAAEIDGIDVSPLYDAAGVSGHDYGGLESVGFIW